jgi:hypothetical protein
MSAYRLSSPRKLLVAAAATALICLCAAEAQAFPPDPARTFTVIPKHTMTNGFDSPIKCLDVGWYSYNFGGKVVQSYCLGGNNQRWGAMGPANSLELVAEHSTQCLGVTNNSQQHAAPAVQWNCDSVQNPSINWSAQLVKTVNGMPFYRLENANSKKCLDVAYASQAAAADVVQATCTSTDNQLWAFYNVFDGTHGL